MKNKFFAAVTLALLSTLGPQLSALFAQGTAFTYPGRLVDSGNPAGGIHDLQFTIYDSLSNASALAGPLTNSATEVGNGLFTVTLDFGTGVFDGPTRWLEMGVRSNGRGAFPTLIPRRPITATPCAITAGAVTGPINGSSIFNGSITGAQLASGAAVANLNAAGQCRVTSGGLVLSTTESAASLNAGYVKIGTTTMGDVWPQRLNGTAPAARRDQTAVWTGSEMIAWGGDNSISLFNDTLGYTLGRVLNLYQRP
jgi:hypothetical protein